MFCLELKHLIHRRLPEDQTTKDTSKNLWKAYFPDSMFQTKSLPVLTKERIYDPIFTKRWCQKSPYLLSIVHNRFGKIINYLYRLNFKLLLRNLHDEPSGNKPGYYLQLEENISPTIKIIEDQQKFSAIHKVSPDMNKVQWNFRNNSYIKVFIY